MMSLFSSFDIMFFKFCFSSFFFVLSFFCFNFWLNSTMISMIDMLNGYMSSFFSSVTSFKFKIFDSLIISLMFSILIFNFSSILPYYFSLTSQISFNFFWGFTLWVSLFSFSVMNNLKYVLSHFVPSGTPIFLIWFLFLVEVVSNIIRPLTLVVRLVANILAGHLLMILLSKMVFIFFPFTFLYLLLNLVEFFVSLIQSYIFVTMLCLYFSEVS